MRRKRKNRLLALAVAAVVGVTSIMPASAIAEEQVTEQTMSVLDSGSETDLENSNQSVDQFVGEVDTYMDDSANLNTDNGNPGDETVIHSESEEGYGENDIPEMSVEGETQTADPSNDSGNNSKLTEDGLIFDQDMSLYEGEEDGVEPQNILKDSFAGDSWQNPFEVTVQKADGGYFDAGVRFRMMTFSEMYSENIGGSMLSDTDALSDMVMEAYFTSHEDVWKILYEIRHPGEEYHGAPFKFSDETLFNACKTKFRHTDWLFPVFYNKDGEYDDSICRENLSYTISFADQEFAQMLSDGKGAWDLISGYTQTGVSSLDESIVPSSYYDLSSGKWVIDLCGKADTFVFMTADNEWLIRYADELRAEIEAEKLRKEAEESEGLNEAGEGTDASDKTGKQIENTEDNYVDSGISPSDTESIVNVEEIVEPSPENPEDSRDKDDSSEDIYTGNTDVDQKLDDDHENASGTEGNDEEKDITESESSETLSETEHAENTESGTEATSDSKSDTEDISIPDSGADDISGPDSGAEEIPMPDSGLEEAEDLENAEQQEGGIEGVEDLTLFPLVEVPESEYDSRLMMSALSLNTLRLLGAPSLRGAAEPEVQDPVTEDGMTIEKIRIKWLSKSNGSDDPAGYDRLMLSPTTDDVTNQQWQIDFALSGKHEHEEGSIEIVMPAYIWKDRNGDEPGRLTLAVPENPETGADFVWRRSGDSIIFTNTRNMSAATKVMIQGTFREVVAHDMVDIDVDATSDYANADYKGVSDPLYATINVTVPNGDVISMTSNEIDAQISTYVEAASATKTAYNPTTKEYYLYWDVPSNIPSDFLPENPENYIYVRWYISGQAQGNQPFTMTVTDNSSGEYGCKVLGVEDALGTNVKSADNETVTALLYDGYNMQPKTAYVWTAYDKSSFDEEFKIYTVHNTQTITVTGWDDKVVTTKTADAEVSVAIPIEYTVVKEWDDNDNELGLRPDHQYVRIWRNPEGDNNRELWQTVRLVENPTPEQQAEGYGTWSYTWSDEGKAWHYETEEVWLAGGTFETWYDEDGNEHKSSWHYYQKQKTYDPDLRKWVYVNTLGLDGRTEILRICTSGSSGSMMIRICVLPVIVL